jgi:hypothetical protein
MMKVVITTSGSDFVRDEWDKLALFNLNFYISL